MHRCETELWHTEAMQLLPMLLQSALARSALR